MDLLQRNYHTFTLGYGGSSPEASSAYQQNGRMHSAHQWAGTRSRSHSEACSSSIFNPAFVGHQHVPALPDISEYRRYFPNQC
jgi:hypothetical protein